MVRNKIIGCVLSASLIFSGTPFYTYAAENTGVQSGAEAQSGVEGQSEIGSFESAPELNVSAPEMESTQNTPALSVDASNKEIMSYMDSLSSKGSISLDDMKTTAQATDIRAMLNAEDYTSVYGDVLKSIESNNPMKLSMAIGSKMNLNVPSSIAADVAVMDYSTVYDTGLLNLQFMALSQSYSNDFIKAENANKSADCMELFNSKFGDVASSLKLENPEIPSSFNPNEMVSKMSAEMNSTYKNSTSKGQFASIKDSISIGNIFSTAQNGLSGAYDRGMPGLSFNSLADTPLSGAYDSMLEKASDKGSEAARLRMADKYTEWKNYAKNQDAGYKLKKRGAAWWGEKFGNLADTVGDDSDRIPEKVINAQQRLDKTGIYVNPNDY